MLRFFMDLSTRYRLQPRVQCYPIHDLLAFSHKIYLLFERSERTQLPEKLLRTS